MRFPFLPVLPSESGQGRPATAVPRQNRARPSKQYDTPGEFGKAFTQPSGESSRLLGRLLGKRLLGTLTSPVKVILGRNRGYRCVWTASGGEERRGEEGNQARFTSKRTANPHFFSSKESILRTVPVAFMTSSGSFPSGGHWSNSFTRSPMAGLVSEMK